MRTVFQPKGSMCIACMNGLSPRCCELPFSEMPAISNHIRIEETGERVMVEVVKCSNFTGARREVRA